MITCLWYVTSTQMCMEMSIMDLMNVMIVTSNKLYPLSPKYFPDYNSLIHLV